MPSPLETREFQARLARLDSLIHDAEHSPDPTAQAHARNVAQAVLDVHAPALERLLELLDEAGDAGRGVLDACARDEVVGGLLLLHGLHPLDLETRVNQALEEVRPALHAHGGNVSLTGITDGVIRLRLEGNCHGCPSSAVTMRQTIEEAIVARAPDAAAIEVEGESQTPSVTPDGRPLVVLSL